MAVAYSVIREPATRANRHLSHRAERAQVEDLRTTADLPAADAAEPSSRFGCVTAETEGDGGFQLRPNGTDGRGHPYHPRPLPPVGGEATEGRLSGYPSSPDRPVLRASTSQSRNSRPHMVGGDQPTTVGRDGDPNDFAMVAAETMELPASLQVPEPDRSIIAA